jgi:hypothetical protein
MKSTNNIYMSSILHSQDAYDTYPHIYQRPTLFVPASNDLAENRAMLESNLVGGSKNKRKSYKKNKSKRVKGGKRVHKNKSKRSKK